MVFFALVHGGAHGGWCWEALTPELEKLGHQWSAPDLPFGETDGISAWADTVIASIPVDAHDVIVVGHSLAGLCVPVIAARHEPVRHMVFLAAMVPMPGKTYLECLAAEPDMISVPGATDKIQDQTPITADDDGVFMSWPRAREAFYQDLPEETARNAWQRLRTQGFRCFSEPSPIEVWPDVPATYILCKDDRSVSPEWSRRTARGRLNAELVELPGGHSPFYGYPQELAAELDRIATAVV